MLIVCTPVCILVWVLVWAGAMGPMNLLATDPTCPRVASGGKHDVTLGSQSVVWVAAAAGLTGDAAAGDSAAGCCWAGVKALAATNSITPPYMPMPHAKRNVPIGCAGRSITVSPVSGKISWIPKLGIVNARVQP